MAATLITGANVWDGVADTPVPRQVLVVGDRIERIAATIDAPPDTGIVDLPGHTLTPGFIDCHTHVALTPNLLELAPQSSPAKTLHALPVLETLLDNGFTTIRDLGCGDVDHPTVDLRDAIAAGLIRGPRMLVAPHILSARGGHGDFSAGIADQYQPGTRGLEFATADGPDEIRTLVRREIRAGADWIKFAATGGFSTPSDDPNHTTYSQQEMDTLVATATDLGVPVTPHCYGDQAVRRAVRAGVRSIDHGNLVSADGLAMLSDAGVYLVPTQYTILTDARHADDDAYWRGKPPYKRAKFVQYRAQLEAAAERLAGSDVKVAFGTDAGMFPHRDNWREFGAMVSTGITPLRALRAATSVAAELLRLDEVGVLAAGKLADLVAMPGDPFTDIEVTGRVDFVMRSGHIHKQPPAA
jgi:tryptophan 2-monooxygenase